MTTLSNHRPADRTGRALVAVLVAAVAALALMASFGHRSARAEAQVVTPASPMSAFVLDAASTAAMTDPSVPSASSALEHAVDGQLEATATF